MKFILWLEEDNKRVPNAKLEKYTRKDARTVDDPSKVIAHKGEPTDWWYSEGSNHRVENGWITRDLQAEDWFVEFNSLEELAEFARQHDGIRIEPHYYNEFVRIVLNEE